MIPAGWWASSFARRLYQKTYWAAGATVRVASSARTAALTVFVTLLVAFAGCSAVQPSEETTANLLVANQDSADHAVVVEIMDGTREVYSAGRTIDGESDAELAAFDRAGEYEVKVTVDGNSTILTHTFETGQTTTTIGIDNQGTVTIGT